MMMPFLSSFSFSLVFIFLLSVHGSPSDNLIYDTCKRCSQDDPNVELHFCTTSLQAVVPAGHSATTDVHKLGEISIKLARRNVTNTRHYVEQLLNRKLSHYVKAALDDCLELYSDAISSTKDAMGYYRTKQYGEVNICMSSVMDAVTTCEDGFAERKGLVSPVKKRNNDTFGLSAVVLSILHMLQAHSH